ncbi:MAG: mucoidy inhibitor MuiA family protein [Candidatus Sericytochromatia bacterium]
MRFVLPVALTLAVLPAMPGLAQSPVRDVDSRITAVTVYPDRAQVTRTARVTLGPGFHQLRFKNLPDHLQPDTVRVGGAGTATALLHGFEMEQTYLGAPPDQEVRSLEERLVTIQDRERTLKDAKGVHERQMAILTKTAERAGNSLANQLALGKAELAEWKALMAFMQTQQISETRAIQQIDQQLRRLAEDRKGVQAQLAKLKGFRRERVRQVPVAVEVTKAGTLDLALEYVIPGARWRPTYDARLDARGDKLDWRYYALVSQQTGEDWSNVKLSLSTAQPAAGSRPPNVPSWFLRLWEPQWERESKRMARPAPAPQAAGKAADGAYAEAEEAAPVQATVSEHGTSVSLDVARPASIPSDGEEHQTPIGQASFSVTPGYMAIPRLSGHAFLEVQAKNEGPWPLLPGSVKAFVGRDYVGTSPLNEDVAAMEPFTLPMGVDRSIVIDRKRLAKRTGEEGLLSKVQVAEYRYEVSIANFKPTAQTVTLVEPLPQSTADAVKVSLLDSSYPPAADSPPGQARWVFKLAPHEKKVLRWGYRVEYPKGAQVIGLE